MGAGAGAGSSEARKDDASEELRRASRGGGATPGLVRVRVRRRRACSACTAVRVPLCRVPTLRRLVRLVLRLVMRLMGLVLVLRGRSGRLVGGGGAGRIVTVAARIIPPPPPNLRLGLRGRRRCVQLRRALPRRLIRALVVVVGPAIRAAHLPPIRWRRHRRHRRRRRRRWWWWRRGRPWRIHLRRALPRRLIGALVVVVGPPIRAAHFPPVGGRSGSDRGRRGGHHWVERGEEGVRVASATRRLAHVR
eukprot:scaffold818_cov64-Phaeocystis_antarctica.AAC.2